MENSITVERDMDVDAASVWSVLATGKDVDLWFGAITSCRREGDQRFCTLEGGGDLVESIVENDADAMRFVYRISEHPLPAGPVLATMHVSEPSPGRANVSWTAAFESVPDGSPALEMTRGLYTQGLVDLEAHAASHDTGVST